MGKECVLFYATSKSIISLSQFVAKQAGTVCTNTLFSPFNHFKGILSIQLHHCVLLISVWCGREWEQGGSNRFTPPTLTGLQYTIQHTHTHKCIFQSSSSPCLINTPHRHIHTLTHTSVNLSPAPPAPWAPLPVAYVRFLIRWMQELVLLSSG